MTSWVDDSPQFLSHWATRKVAGSSRINARSWAVMAHLERRGHGVGSATLSSAQVQKWLTDFHSMGLVGLMDAPRMGRPVKPAELRSKDANWRTARISGSDGQRVHRHAVRIYGLESLLPLASLFVWNELKVLAFTAADQDEHELLNGDWVDVTRKITKECSFDSVVRMPTLVDALQAIRQMTPPTLRSQQEQCIRFVGRLRSLCAKNRVSIDVVVSAPPDSSELNALLVEFRKSQLWARQPTHKSGVLRTLRFHASGKDLSLQKFLEGGIVLQPPIPLRSSPRMTDFFLALDLKKSTIFEWHRRPDDPLPQSRSNDFMDWVP